MSKEPVRYSLVCCKRSDRAYIYIMADVLNCSSHLDVLCEVADLLVTACPPQVIIHPPEEYLLGGEFL